MSHSGFQNNHFNKIIIVIFEEILKNHAELIFPEMQRILSIKKIFFFNILIFI